MCAALILLGKKEGIDLTRLFDDAAPDTMSDCEAAVIDFRHGY